MAATKNTESDCDALRATENEWCGVFKCAQDECVALKKVLLGEEHQHNFTTSTYAIRAPQSSHHCRLECVDECAGVGACKKSIHGRRSAMAMVPIENAWTI